MVIISIANFIHKASFVKLCHRLITCILYFEIGAEHLSILTFCFYVFCADVEESRQVLLQNLKSGNLTNVQSHVEGLLGGTSGSLYLYTIGSWMTISHCGVKLDNPHSN